MNAASGVLANDTDPDGDVLTVAAFDAASARGGAVAMNTDGRFTYTPPAGYTGTDSFPYTATDGAAQDAATVSLFVSASGTPQFDAIISSMPEAEWVQLNVNEFQDVWVGADQLPSLPIGGSPKAMGWTPPPATASMCQSGSVTDHLNREGRPHEGYDDRL